MTLLQAVDLSYSYGDKPIFSNLSLQISQGKSFAIIGPNGSGKTTLLRILSGSIPSFQGEVLFNGRKITSFGKKELARIYAYVEQEGIPELAFSVEEIVLMGRYPWLKAFSTFSKKDAELVHDTLQSLDILHLRNRPVYQLSGGERQLVSLAKSMVQRPKILFLDEPTTYLDIGNQQLIMEHVKRWQIESGLTVVMVLHDINLAAQYGDELMLMGPNGLVDIGTSSEVINQGNLERVYQTKTIMIEHPTKKVPQILLSSNY